MFRMSRLAHRSPLTEPEAIVRFEAIFWLLWEHEWAEYIDEPANASGIN